MVLALSLLLPVAALSWREVPAGATLHVRLLSPVASYSSRAGTPVRAVVIAPVEAHGEIVIPAGAQVQGRVKSASRVGLGIVHERAALDVRFESLGTVFGRGVPLSARLVEVDNSRERVLPSGTIQGIRTTSTVSYRVGGYIRTFIGWHLQSSLAFWLVRSLLVQIPEPEIYYPAGSEMTLALTEPLRMPGETQTTRPRSITPNEVDRIESTLNSLPGRAHAAVSGRLSDVLNIVIIGRRDVLAAAFAEAGWARADAHSMRTAMKGVQAFAEGRGYPTAPMSMLHLNYREPDLTLQKGLNDFSKRHHVRLWDTQARWGDEEVWVGAGTRDIAFAYFRRRGSPITHRIEQDVDQERDKIVNDLSFTPCVDSVGLVNRPDLARVSRNGTGDLMTTDGQVAIVHLAACAPVSLTAAASDELPIRASGNVGYRFARREILWFRNDMLRNNVYWRGFEGGWWLFSALRRHFRPSGLDPDPCYREPPSSPALASITRADPIPHHEVADLPVDCCRPAGGIRSGTFDSEPRLR